jgi:hypothetical protein
MWQTATRCIPFQKWRVLPEQKQGNGIVPTPMALFQHQVSYLLVQLCKTFLPVDTKSI